jgi:hypothetical protein
MSSMAVSGIPARIVPNIGRETGTLVRLGIDMPLEPVRLTMYPLRSRASRCAMAVAVPLVEIWSEISRRVGGHPFISRLDEMKSNTNR